tara:strand:- start:265 stop:999 length:735 start_codon:yes stop_codon:yes gene_type:complete
MTSTQISPSSSKISEEIQKLEPSALIELFELKLTLDVNGIDQTFYYHAGKNEVKTDIVFGGQAYAAVPCEVKGFDKITKGTLPRPTFSVANANSAITNLMLLYSPLNAELKRIQTHKKFLDAVNFSSGLNPTADPTAIAQIDDIWYIDRVAEETPTVVTFELIGKIAMQNLRLPKRQVLEHCPWLYKGTQCGYKGTNYFNTNDEPVSSQSDDRCGHKYTSCLLRFSGKNEKVPFGGFLNARLQM